MVCRLYNACPPFLFRMIMEKKKTCAQKVINKRIREKVKLGRTDIFQFYQESYSDYGYNDYSDYSDYYDAT